jgi:hypothetical protein
MLIRKRGEKRMGVGEIWFLACLFASFLMVLALLVRIWLDP